MMTPKEGKREVAYQVTMNIARKMLKSGLITYKEYTDFEKQMLEKYNPVMGDIFTRKDLYYL